LVEEFDLLILVTLAVALWRGWEAGEGEPTRGWPKRGIALFAACFCVSVLVGVLPLEPLDAETLFTYYSKYNALRIAKGFVWAIMLLPLLRRGLESPGKEKRFFAAGVLTGLVFVVLFGVWERYAFPGLLNFTDDYRITSTFPEMHVGGESIDAYLALTIPFVAACFLPRRRWPYRFGGIVLLLLSLYTLLVTYSRIGVASVAVSAAVLILGLVSARGRGGKPAAVAGLFVLIVASVGVVPAARAQYMKERFARTSGDLRDRVAQWRGAVAIMDSGVRTLLFGMGVGSYPRVYALGNRGYAASVPFTLMTEEGNRFVRLGTGDSLYFGQRVPVRQGEVYTVSLDVRSGSGDTLLNIPVCEKSLLYSSSCSTLSVRPGNTGDKWVRHTLELRTDGIGAGRSRPVELALSNGGKGGFIDVDNVSLADKSGNELVNNGTFSDKGAHWFFTVDNYVPWHVENIWVHILFEQGWCGVVSICLLVGYGFVNLVARIHRGDVFAAIFLSSLSGFLVVGLTASLVDVPRIGALFFMVLFASMMRPAAFLSNRGG
jgi:hypothetical protein